MILQTEQLTNDQLAILAEVIGEHIAESGKSNKELVPLMNFLRNEYVSMVKDPVRIAKQLPQKYVELARHYFDINLDELFEPFKDIKTVQQKANYLRAKVEANRRRSPGKAKAKPKLEDKKLEPPKELQKHEHRVPDPPDGKTHAEGIQKALKEQEKLNGVENDGQTFLGLDDNPGAEDMTIKKASSDTYDPRKTASGILSMAMVQDKLAEEKRIHDELKARDKADNDGFLKDIPKGAEGVEGKYLIEATNLFTRKTYIITIGQLRYRYDVTDNNDGQFHITYESPNGESTITIVESTDHLYAMAHLISKLL